MHIIHIHVIIITYDCQFCTGNKTFKITLTQFELKKLSIFWSSFSLYIISHFYTQVPDVWLVETHSLFCKIYLMYTVVITSTEIDMWNKHSTIINNSNNQTMEYMYKNASWSWHILIFHYSFSTTSLGAEYILFRFIYRETDSRYNTTSKSGTFVA